MKNVEFSIKGDGETIMVIEDQEPRKFTETDIDIIKEMLRSMESYPKALKALHELYGKLPNSKFRMVRRWIKCNWGNDDEVLDIDEVGNFNFEHVRCPLRGGDCPWEGTICHPVNETDLTAREKDVVRLISRGFTLKEIAEHLSISIKTVESHRDNIFSKTDCNKITQVVSYAHKHHLV